MVNESRKPIFTQKIMMLRIRFLSIVMNELHLFDMVKFFWYAEGIFTQFDWFRKKYSGKWSVIELLRLTSSQLSETLFLLLIIFNTYQLKQNIMA